MFADIHNLSRQNTNNTNSSKTPYVVCSVFGKQEVASATFPIKALRKTPVAPLCEWINAREKRLNYGNAYSATANFFQ